MAAGSESIILQPGEGRTIETLGSKMGFKAVTEDTGGLYSLIEYEAGPNFSGPAPHIHLEMEEGFYVIEGAFDLQVGEESVRAPAGSFILIPLASFILSPTPWISRQSSCSSRRQEDLNTTSRNWLHWWKSTVTPSRTPCRAWPKSTILGLCRAPEKEWILLKPPSNGNNHGICVDPLSLGQASLVETPTRLDQDNRSP